MLFPIALCSWEILECVPGAVVAVKFMGYISVLQSLAVVINVCWCRILIILVILLPVNVIVGVQQNEINR